MLLCTTYAPSPHMPFGLDVTNFGSEQVVASAGATAPTGTSRPTNAASSIRMRVLKGSSPLVAAPRVARRARLVGCLRCAATATGGRPSGPWSAPPPAGRTDGDAIPVSLVRPDAIPKMGHAVGTEVTKMRRGRGGDPLRGNAKGPEPEGRGHVRRPSDPTHVAVL